MTGRASRSRSAAEVERKVHQARAEVERTLELIQDQLSPGQLFDQAITYVGAHGGAESVRHLVMSARRNPLPVALVGLGLGWMLSGRLGDGEDGRDPSGSADDRRAAGDLPADGEPGASAAARGTATVRRRQGRQLERQVPRGGPESEVGVLEAIAREPLVVGAIGVAIGAAIATALPRILASHDQEPDAPGRPEPGREPSRRGRRAGSRRSPAKAAGTPAHEGQEAAAQAEPNQPAANRTADQLANLSL